MINRRAAIGISTALGLTALSAVPAKACRVLRKESRTPASAQIEDIAVQIESGNATGAIVANDRLRVSIREFVSTTAARRDMLGATEIETVVSEIYAEGDVQVFLVNFHAKGSNMIVLSCGDNFENNHAFIGFKAGTIQDFQPMTTFNAVNQVELTSRS